MADAFELPPTDDLESDEGISLREYWNTLLKRFWTIVFVFVATVTGVALYTFQQPKVYQAEALVIINLDSQNVLGNGISEDDYSGAGDWFTLSKHLETQLHVIRSRKVAERVVEAEGLAEDLAFLGFDGLNDDQLAAALEASDPAARLLSMMVVEPVPDTQIVSVKIINTDPKLAARLANGVAEAYKAHNISGRVESLDKAFDWLNGQLKKYEDDLKDQYAAINNFKATHPMLFTDPEHQQTLTTQKLGTLDGMLLEAERERRSLGYRLAELDRFEVKSVGSAGLSILAEHATLGDLTSQYIALKRQETDLLHHFLETTPEVQSVRDQIDIIEKAISAELRSIRRGYQSLYDVVSKSETDLRGQRDEVRTVALDLDKLKLMYEEVENKKLEQERLFELIQRRLNEVTLAKVLESEDIKVLDQATVPESPISPDTTFNILAGAVLGLLAGIGFAFLLEMMDSTIKSQEDIEGRLNVPFLGVIPSVKESDRRGAVKKMGPDEEYKRDLHVNYFPKSSIAECARTIRTNLLFMAKNKPLQVLLITSPSPLDGKTMSALSLATVMAQSNSRVLILDCDLRRPRMHKAFGLEVKVGVADALIGEATLDEAILKTDVENLDLLPCGTVPPNPSELFHTDAFQKVLDDLKERYDRIIIDSPPVIAVTDAMILAGFADKVIVVTKAGSTRRELLKRTHQLLTRIDAPLAGAILNNVNLENRRYGTYYYYYYRQYGQYYEETPDRPG